MLTHHRPKPEAPERVVVLGGSGFIGRALIATLQAAGIVHLVPRRDKLDLAAEGAGERLGALLRPTDAVVVLSAVTPDKGRGVAAFSINVRIGVNVCAALEQVPPDHLVYVSSDAVYPLSVGLVTEETCGEPTDLYGAMHLGRELMMKTSVQSPVAVLRPTLVYGAADTHNSYGPNRLRRMAHKDGRIILFGAGEEMRDHIAIDDVATLIALTLSHRSAGTLNLATGRSISYAELAAKVAELVPTPVEIAFKPRQVPITHRHFDITALRRAFPTFVLRPLEEGLAAAYREMLERQ
jgi:nucleoside-diphosphate-sugar epimerase